MLSCQYAAVTFQAHLRPIVKPAADLGRFGLLHGSLPSTKTAAGIAAH